MSTILHPLQHHSRIYTAAAALAVGVLIILMTSVFGQSGTVTTPEQTGILNHGHAHAYRVPCFAGHSQMSIELSRSACQA